MNKTAIVIFQSKTGYTQKYAEWIAEELSCGLVPLNGMTVEALEPYQMIIYGGGLRAGQVSGLKKLKKTAARQRKQKVDLFLHWPDRRHAGIPLRNKKGKLHSRGTGNCRTVLLSRRV